MSRVRALPPAAGACALAALLLLAPAARAAFLTGSVDHDFMGANETFNYVLSLSDGDSSAPPDLTPLARDFEIVDRTRRSRTDEVGGRQVDVNEWVMTLAPKRAGVLTVPGLTVKGQTSAPLKVQVVPAVPVEPPAGNPPLFVRVDAGEVGAYAQSLVPVSIRIFDSLGMRSGRFGELKADGAAFTPEGKQRVYFRTIGGKRYGVIEQSFLMQPQKSGRIEIEPLTVNATVPARTNPAASAMPNLLGRGGFLPTQGEDVTLRARPVTLNVAPRPEAAQGWFLPAREVRLTQQWSAPPETAKAGVALARTIRLKARGASPNQLPPLPLAEVDGVRQYEDAAQSGRVTIDGETGAELVQTVSVVPARAGTFTLPAIEVGWWNTATGRQERAALPPVTLQVTPEDGGSGFGAATAAPAAPPAPERAAPTPAAPGPNLMELLERVPVLAWAGAAAALLLALVAMLVRRGLIRRRAARAAAARAARPRFAPARPDRPAKARAPAFASAGAAEDALVRACKAGDAPSAHAAFVAWMRLSAGADGLRTPRMALAVRGLYHALYRPEAPVWKGREFLAAFRAEQTARRKAARGARKTRIAPLYPSG
ncbi:BatD family protein [Xanthobacter sp. KR7-225]|uniref:BatD family protein n=1 Tax=Xanthobacter sp. KR7-225 TaxID=3156613 RepID=UPI0032B36FA7